MNHIFARLSVSLLLCVLLTSIARAADDYQPGPDSIVQPGVPKGEILNFTFDQSKIFPGTTREYSIYIPSQYTGDKPACLFVSQDGIKHNAPVVFDNLINKKEMPVTIGVFIKPGVLKATDPEHALDRFNRSYEYDGLGDSYVRFLVEEILPEVETKKTSDGRAIKISHDANDRAIGGESSGAICAFNAAWERPSEFSRVFSCIGTFVDLRGGSRFPTLIRKYEPKPIRIFMQDGSADNNIYGGDWWMANQTMERALVFSGYEVNHAWGDGAHNGKHPTAIFPDAMRYLWKDWPQPVKNGPSKNQFLQDLLIPGEGWQLVSEGYKFTEGPACNSKGEVFFTDGPNNKTHKIALDGTVSVAIEDRRGNGQHFGPDGRLYAVGGPDDKVMAYGADMKGTAIAEQIRGNDLVIAHNGNIYITAPAPSTSTDPSSVWLVKPDGSKQVVDSGIRFPNGVTLSPDQSLLYVADYRSHWVYSFQVEPDGTLKFKQKYYHLHEPDSADDAGPDGIRCDHDGRLYVATRMGIQICDQAGRVNCIIPTPNGRVSNLCFGGEKFDSLFATCGDKVFKRKLKVQGAPSWQEPSKPAAPRL